MLGFMQLEQHGHVLKAVVDMFKDFFFQRFHLLIEGAFRVSDSLIQSGFRVVDPLTDFAYAAIRIEQHSQRNHNADGKGKYLGVGQEILLLVDYQLIA
jgi:hypothetical protein